LLLELFLNRDKNIIYIIVSELLTDKENETFIKLMENNTNTVSDPLRELIMRYLCIEKVTVYFLTPGEEKKSFVNPSKFFHAISGWSVKMICSQNFCHYNLLI
jgi:hypothetical protein